jgi:putative SOS response-associated peptidase YedK
MCGRYERRGDKQKIAEAFPFWRDKFASNRCIVPASSFFEWKDAMKGPKPKYEITVLDREFFWIAAVWAEWRNPKTQKWEKTFATFTSEPNEHHERDSRPTASDPRPQRF